MRVALVCVFVGLFVGFEAQAKKPTSKKTPTPVILVNNIEIDGQACRITENAMMKGQYDLQCESNKAWVTSTGKTVSPGEGKEWLVLQMPPADSEETIRAWVVAADKKIEAIQCVPNTSQSGWIVQRGNTSGDVTIQWQQQKLACKGKRLVVLSLNAPPAAPRFPEQPDAQ